MPRLLKIYPVLMSEDIRRSITFYRDLGFETVFLDSPEEPKYAALERDGIVLHFQWNDMSAIPESIDRPTYRFLVDDVDGLFAEIRAAGIFRTRGPMKTTWGTYEFHVQDHERNGLQFFSFTDPVLTEPQGS